jgi:AcrR family transcriptional regulator
VAGTPRAPRYGGEEDADLSRVRSVDRPRPRDGSSEIEATIFEATERLLGRMPFRDIRIPDILEEAGISRGTFYHYFSSKWAVIAALLPRVTEEIAGSLAPFIEQDAAVNVRDALRQSITAGARVWASHRGLLRTVQEHWSASDDLREQWLTMNAFFVERIAHEIERERRAGKAPPGLDSRQLAAMLVWSSGQLMFVAGTGVEPALPDEEAIVETLPEFWLAAVYGPSG